MKPDIWNLPLNLKVGIILIVFLVALGAVIVGQRVQVRSVGFEAAQLNREMRELEEQNRVLRQKHAAAANPAEMIRRIRSEGINLLPPEDKLPDIPGKRVDNDPNHEPKKEG